MAGPKGDTRFQIFRAADAPDLRSTGAMRMAEQTAAQSAGLARLREAGMPEGGETRVLVSVPGFSLTHVWFKKDYPLPLHSHNADCLYYIIAGSIELGTEKLGPRDSFLIPAGAPYTYRPGPEGVELIEIRHESEFDFRNHAKNPVFYDKAVATIEANLESWRTATRPSLNS
jgi:mannose-6-phosphate isomerase-like protein (cupin superfamily)